ncbi:MAG: uroporphyrinogen decarboxylase family protein [Armatimonadota bacterium]
MKTMLSSRERLERTLRGESLDRVPIRLWGVDPLVKAGRPCWQFLPDMVNEFGLDTFFGWGPTWPASKTEITRENSDTANPEWYEEVTTYKTPAGDISSIFVHNRLGKPGYIKKHLIESVEDAKRWLSMPDNDLPDVSSFPARVAEVGDRGMVLAGLGEGMYAVNDATGSELWGLWMYDERELVHEMVAKAAQREYAIARHYIEHGIGPLFGWVGPELCIPPLASPRDFDDLVTRYDKPIIDLIHNAGGFVWVHCHGDMNPVLERFADMGVDCLNPIEPPPIGHLTLADAKRRVGDRMTLEGGIESGDFELDDAVTFAAKIEQAMAMGKPGGRYILCPSSDHSHWPEISDKIINNYRVFVETGLRLAEY